MNEIIVDLADISKDYFDDVECISLLWLILFEELLSLGYSGLLRAAEEGLLDVRIDLGVQIMASVDSEHIIRIIDC